MIGTQHREEDAVQKQAASAPSLQVHSMGPVTPTFQKSHIVAALLAFFGGMFGMHKFYLGYNKAAFTMLAVTVIGGIITLGLAGAVVWVIAIIEGVIYLTKTQSEFDKVYVRGQRDWF